MEYYLKITKVISFLYLLIKYKSFKIALLFSRYQVNVQTTAKIKRTGNYLDFTKTGNKIHIDKFYTYGRYLKLLITILSDKQFLVVPDYPTKGIILKINDISILLLSEHNIFIAYEIYLQQLYNLSTPHNNNVVLDIGMNVGYATLFFASLENVSHVYSYEPFEETFKEASDNIDLNPHLKHKIKIFNYGISNISRSIEVPQFESGSPVASTSEFFLDSRKKAVSSRNVKVEVKNIAEVLNTVVSNHPQQTIFLKVDCEGEEYNIMEKLSSDGGIKNIAGFFIEWHIKGPNVIIDILKDNNFTSFHLPNVGHRSGIIYAFKQNI